MPAKFNIEDRRHVLNALASSLHGGGEPNREDVENLTNYLRGAISEAEYDRRTRDAAEQARANPVEG